MLRTEESQSHNAPNPAPATRRGGSGSVRAQRSAETSRAAGADSQVSSSPRMFDNDLLDALSRVPYWVVPLIYLPVIGLSAAYAVSVEGLSLPGLALCATIGWFVWTLMEYWLHRTLFHWIPAAPWGERFHFYLHGVHHDWYRDRLRLVMPPAASLAVGVVVASTLAAIGRMMQSFVDDAWVFGLFAGVVFGYLVYDMIHYYVHHAKPKNSVLLALRAHHSKHHHNPKFKEKKFGVSTTVWDHVFGTYG